MQKTDNDFFEEFKRLERLCSDMYSQKHGVSLYIDEMNEKRALGESMFSDWRKNYNLLKHLRYLRNQIAHGEGDNVCSNADVEEIKWFYNMIISGNDPLALLAKASRKNTSSKSSQSKTYFHEKTAPKKETQIPVKNRVKTAFCFLLMCLLAWGIVCVMNKFQFFIYR